MIKKDEEYYENVFLQILENMEKNLIVKEKPIESKLIIKDDNRLEERCLECKKTLREIAEKRKSMLYFNKKTKICVSCQQKKYHAKFLEKKRKG